MTSFYRVTDPCLVFDGKEYAAWRIVAVEDGKPLAVSYRTEAMLPLCPLCGELSDFGELHQCKWFCAQPSEADGWEKGLLLTGEEEAREQRAARGARWYHAIPYPTF